MDVCLVNAYRSPSALDCTTAANSNVKPVTKDVPGIEIVRYVPDRPTTRQQSLQPGHSWMLEASTSVLCWSDFSSSRSERLLWRPRHEPL